MSTKLIACLLAACVVAVGGVHLYTGKGFQCPFSSSCPTSECMLEKTGSCCDAEDGSCCDLKAVSTKVSCCDGEATTTCPITAAFGGAVSAVK